MSCKLYNFVLHECSMTTLQKRFTERTSRKTLCQELYDLNDLKLSAEKMLDSATLSEPEQALPGLLSYCFTPPWSYKKKKKKKQDEAT